MVNLLTTNNISLLRGERWLWRPLTVDLRASELALITGENGSGKTSLLKVFAGLVEPTSGSVAVTAQVSYLGHANGLYPDKTPHQYLKVFKNAREALFFWQLSEVQDIPIARLSCGQKRRLALSRIALSQKSLWLLDEPLTGLDIQGQNLFWQAIQQHQAEGGAVVMTHHTDIPQTIHVKIQCGNT